MDAAALEKELLILRQRYDSLEKEEEHFELKRSHFPDH